MPDSLGVVVLAAGQGTRMKSSLNKMLHPLAGLPLVEHVLRAARSLAPERIVLVISPHSEQVRAHLGDSVEYALQDPPQGTGDAVRVARPYLNGGIETVLVLYGDTPLVRPETLERLLSVHCRQRPLVTLLTGYTHDPGRVLRDEQGRVVGVVEPQLATPEQLAIPERNSGVCAFSAEWLWRELETLRASPTGEYLLTELFGRAAAVGKTEGGWPLAAVQVEDPTEAIGVNNRAQLAEAEALLRRRLLERLMLSGVTVTDPSSTYVHADVRVGSDTTLLPGTHLVGGSVIGSGCTIGPSAYIADSSVGDGCRVQWSVVESSRIDSGSDCGPYSHLRPGTHIESGVHIGNFVETKKTRIGSGSASGHFSYLGDADIGKNVNIGAGTVTANYDGARKNPTKIGDNAFIGVDTMLRAPVEIGEGARTGAGAVVTRDVPPGRLAVGMPARLVPARAEAGSRSLPPDGKGEREE